MDGFSYSGLESTYNGWVNPMAHLVINEKNFADNKGGLTISDIDVELTCGFEASQAAFSIFDCYDFIHSEFEYKKFKDYIILGSTVVLSLGYNMEFRKVFRGIIVRVEFVIDEGQAPHVRVTAMDIKSIMMSNHYHKKLMADTYSGAVKEILTTGVYSSLIGVEMANDMPITKISVTDTPDALDISTDIDTDKTVEMVGESDYEFIVRAAKKFNYEFFVNAGDVIFRPSRGDVTTLIKIPNKAKIINMNVSYDMTGLVGKVTVRGLDVGKAKAVEKSLIHKFTISAKPTSKKLLMQSSYVYVDPSVTSKSDAERRASYLFDDMSYRFGNLDMELFGVPEIIPGRFMDLTDFGSTVSNSFYIKKVHHHLDTTGRYTTRVYGEAQQINLDLGNVL